MKVCWRYRSLKSLVKSEKCRSSGLMVMAKSKKSLRSKNTVTERRSLGVGLNGIKKRNNGNSG